MKRILHTCLALLASATPLLALQPPAGGSPGQDGFVPLDSLPKSEQLPAAPLLIVAYAFVWVLLMVYLWSIAKRLRKVETEVDTLQRRQTGGAGR